jgi:hypothetical protein
MIDGAIYWISTRFMEEVSGSDDWNAAFWAGNFRCVDNPVDVFLDIDNVSDMYRFKRLVGGPREDDFYFIGNVCVGDFQNAFYKTEHISPFCVSASSQEDFIKLVERFNKIDFSLVDFSSPTFFENTRCC